MPSKYMLENAFRFLSESGLADEILNSEGGFKIRYSKIPAEARSSKHRRVTPENSPTYHRFLSDYLRAVICLCDENFTGRSIKMASKYLSMNAGAVELFRRGWKILEESL